jgi:O-antigen ligase
VNWRYLPTQGGVLLTLALCPLWLKHGSPPPPFTATYTTGFVLFWSALLTLGVWLLAGVPGLRAFMGDRLRIVWALLLLLLVGWAVLAQGWALTRSHHPGVAQNAALQLGVVAGFVLVVACAGPPLRAVIAVLALSLLWNALVGGLQVAVQGSIGLGALAELALDPARSGVSVIQAGDVRWLRPYGLLPHPNVFAGAVVVWLLAVSGWLLHDNKRVRWSARLAFVVGFWLLLLTFSRGAWLGFAMATLAFLPMILAHDGTLRRLLPIVGVMIALGLIFLLLYRPLVFARAGISMGDSDTIENTEQRSIIDRVIFIDIALDAINQNPMIGLGGANFPWYAANYLANETDYDLQGDNVHHVPLGVWADYGIVGLGLLYAWLIVSVELALQHVKRAGYPLAAIGLLAGFLALVVVGQFDHYPWTLLHTQLLWLSLPAFLLRQQIIS